MNHNSGLSFQTNPKYFQKVAKEFFLNYWTEFSIN